MKNKKEMKRNVKKKIKKGKCFTNPKALEQEKGI